MVARLDRFKGSFVLTLALLVVASLCIVLPPLAGEAVAAQGSWAKKDSGTTRDLNSVSAVNASRVWAAGDGGTILYSWDGGSHWGSQKSTISTDLYGISMNNDASIQGWAAGDTSLGARNVVYFDGHTWSKQARWVNRHFRGVSTPGRNHCVLIGLGADSYRTIDGGSNWPSVSWAKSKDMYDVTSYYDATGDFTAWIVGENGAIAHAQNLSVSREWKTQSSPVDALILRGVSAVDRDTVYAVGDNGTILKTEDGGATQWKQQASPTAKHLRGVCAVDEDTAWAVGEDGTIIKTENGKDWSVEASGTSKNLNGVSAVDSENAWAVGEDGTILRYVPPPEITDCDPGSANQGEYISIEITGSNTHFREGQSNVEMGAGVTVDSVHVVSATEINARITIADNAEPGMRDVQVTTGSEVPTPLIDGFEVHQKPQVPPRLDDIEPGHGTTGTAVTLSGSDFGETRGDSYVVFSYGVEVTDYHSWTDKQIVCEVPSGAETGPVFVHTWTDSNKNRTFTVDKPHLPAITDVSPSHVKQGQSGYVIEIVGDYTHFGAGSTTVFSPPEGITVVNTQVQDSSRVTATIDVAADAQVGSREVNVVTGSETPEAFSGFQVQKSQTTPPELDGLDPDWGYYGDKVTLSGKHFGAGRNGSRVTFHDGVEVTDYLSWSDNSIEVTVPGGATTGPVTVTTSQGTSGGELFTVSEPYIKECDPTRVHQGNTVTLDVAGEFTHFQAGESHIVVTGGGVQVGTTSVYDESHASAQITVADDAAPGTRDISVVTGSETPEPLKNVFTVLPKYQSPPALRSLHPTAGTVGSLVTILGERFGEARGSSTVTFNGTPVTNYVSWEDDKIECMVPIGASSGLVKLNTSWGTSNGLYFDVLDYTFYFAEGTCRPGFDPYFSIQNPDSGDAQVKITYMTGSGTVEEQELTVPGKTRSTVTVKQKLGEGDDPAHDFSAAVACTNGEEIIVERPMYFNYQGMTPGGTDVIGAVSTSEQVFFAEGTCRPGFVPYFTIQNPGQSNIREELVYMKGDATTASREVEITPTTRVTVNAIDTLGVGDDPAHDFSTTIQGDDGAQIVAERPQYFDYHGWCTGGTCVVGVQSPTESFYLAEGTCRKNFDPYITIQNPATHQSEVLITYMRGDGETQDQSITMAPQSRSTVAVKNVLGSGDSNVYDFSALVRTTDRTDIIVERPMYFDYEYAWTGGSDTVGAVSDGSAFYFAEGTCRPGFVPYLTIQNPNLGPADVTVTYMRGDGQNQEQQLTLAPHSRYTVTVVDILGQGDSPIYDFSSSVVCTNGREIVAERPMYFNYNGAWPGGHDVVGFSP